MISNADLKQEVLNHYMDADGLVTIDHDPGKWTTGNGLLHTGLFYTMLEHFGLIDESDRSRFHKTIKACEVVPGVYNRNPGRSDREAYDDYTGVVVGSDALGLTDITRDVYEYGIKHQWCFDNTKPGESSYLPNWAWHGRFIGQVPMYIVAAREPTCLMDRVQLSGKLFLNRTLGLNGDSGSRIQCYLAASLCANRGVCVDAAGAYFKWAHDRYLSLGNMFSYYFPYNHPISRFRWD